MGAVLAAPEQLAILTGLLTSDILAVVAGSNGWPRDEEGRKDEDDEIQYPTGCSYLALRGLCRWAWTMASYVLLLSFRSPTRLLAIDRPCPPSSSRLLSFFSP